MRLTVRMVFKGFAGHYLGGVTVLPARAILVLDGPPLLPMTEPPPAAANRARVLQSLATEFLADEAGRILIAVDGVDGSGKSTFANDLAEVIRVRPVIVIHADDFLNLRAVRHRLGATLRKDSGSTPTTTRLYFAMCFSHSEEEGAGPTARRPPTTIRTSGSILRSCRRRRTP